MPKNIKTTQLTAKPLAETTRTFRPILLACDWFDGNHQSSLKNNACQQRSFCMKKQGSHRLILKIFFRFLNSRSIF